MEIKNWAHFLAHVGHMLGTCFEIGIFFTKSLLVIIGSVLLAKILIAMHQTCDSFLCLMTANSASFEGRHNPMFDIILVLI